MNHVHRTALVALWGSADMSRGQTEQVARDLFKANDHMTRRLQAALSVVLAEDYARAAAALEDRPTPRTLGDYSELELSRLTPEQLASATFREQS